MKVTLGPLLGEGGFSRVYQGEDAIRSVAVKVMTESAELTSSIKDHADALARVDHPNVVRVYYMARVQDPETGQQANALVMELVDGRPLNAYLHSVPLTRADAERIGCAIVDGVAALHQAGVAHTDLHAPNVLVGRTS